MRLDFGNLRATYNELVSDVEAAKKLNTDYCHEDFIKRTYTHSFFALVEGVTAQLKQVALEANEKAHIFEAYEIELLTEQSGFLASNGVAKQVRAKLQLMPNIIFSLNYAAKALSLNFEVNKNSGYESMLKAIKIRDRITHPKSKASLIINNHDMNVLGNANAWFRDETVRLLNQIRETHEAR